MAVQPAATLTPIPEFPALSDRAAGTYNSKAYAFGTHMGGPGPFVGEINALAANVHHNAQEAVNAADGSGDAQVAAEAARDAAAESAGAADGFSRNAASSATAAAESAGAAADSDIAAAQKAQLADAARQAAQDARGQTQLLRSETEALRNQTQALRNQAETFATGQLKGSSTTSVVPGAGAKSFAMEASRSFVAGMYLIATSVSDPATQMSGPVQSYDPATGALVIAVDKFAGAAARADWAIGIAARAGATALARQDVTANTLCVAGVEYVVVAPGITLTLPTNWSTDEEIAITEAIGNGAQYTIVFGGTKLRSQTMGTQVISAVFGSTGVLRHRNPAQGLV